MDVRKAWNRFSAGEEIPPAGTIYFQTYCEEVAKALRHYAKDGAVLLSDSSLRGAQKLNEELISRLGRESDLDVFSGLENDFTQSIPAKDLDALRSLRKLTLNRLYRISRRYLMLENESMSEEDVVFQDEFLTFCFLKNFSENLAIYLKATSSMVTLEEGRLQLESVRENLLFFSKYSSKEFFKKSSCAKEEITRITHDYFEAYAFCMKVNHAEDLNWSFLRGLLQRYLNVLRKSNGSFNRVLIAQQIKKLIEALISAIDVIPTGVPSHGQGGGHGLEKRCYQRLTQSLFFLVKPPQKENIHVLF